MQTLTEQQKKDAKELTGSLTDYVNYRKSSKAFIEAFKREHRTLQQSTFRLFLELMEEIASDNFQTDGRNESSKEVAKTLMKGFKMAMKEKYMNEGVIEKRAEEYVRIGDKPSKYLLLI
jgi:hypothetical protein